MLNHTLGILHKKRRVKETDCGLKSVFMQESCLERHQDKTF